MIVLPYEIEATKAVSGVIVNDIRLANLLQFAHRHHTDRSDMVRASP